ncbi:F-box/LRR-repeat protein 21-like [Mizuhopecten yessoensis]|uniref:F-box/LRR-repeat protein 21 n=1 Tax=Mizuhopecten yessoensis TaxID=6573 RepID=A0A210PGG8_MIZYE|nr:F-box/LRR-repeat protein 21-like [Mizuhopecten yessoensis]XP_021342227.1 F-box/LRR-repeat protein 21-like [Mizuhopecten yessoensis]OWF35582.1 F-box/LRR-repeat protein 21 [Mizuhopecten yessoensis]
MDQESDEVSGVQPPIQEDKSWTEVDTYTANCMEDVLDSDSPVNREETQPPADDCHESGPDFSQLPEVVWVEIMSYLPLHQQYLVSQTCQVLYEIFNHPSLWHTMKIHLFGCTDNFSRAFRSKICIPNKYIKLINKFGKFFKQLTLSVTEYLNKFPEEWISIMQELSRQCRLESLTLEIGRLTSYYHIDGYQPSENDIGTLVSFIQNAVRLKYFHIKSWPMYPSSLSNPDLNIFEVILKNPKLKDLETLSLFWCKATEWSERMPILPSPEATLPIIHNFQHLKKLSLRSPMLDKDIILELSKPGRCKLKLLQVFVHFHPENGNFKIPEIESSVWKQFVLANPGVEMECTVLVRTPHLELASMLKTDCPLTAITFMKFSRCDSQIVASLSEMYCRSLKKFACYCDPSCKENEVVSLAMRSPNLNQFVYYGPLSCESVEKLAQLHGTGWKEFVIPASCITVQDVPSYDDDDDRVIAPGEDGEYYLVGIARFHQSVHPDSQRKQEMQDKVSAALGYSWKPV